MDGIQLQPPPKHNVENAQAVDLNRKFDDVAQEHKRDDASTISMMSNAVMSDKKNDYSKIITCFPQLKRLEDQQVNDEIMQYQKELEK